MNEKDIEFATAQIILSALKGGEELEIVVDPLGEIMKLCDQIKNVIRGYSQGMPDDLPVKLTLEVGEKAYLLSATNKWSTSESTLPRIEKANYIRDILNRLPRSLDTSYVKKELKGAPDSFIKELHQLDGRSLKLRVKEWSSEELEDVFDHVGTSKRELGANFLSAYRSQDKNKKVRVMRDTLAKNINRVFVERGSGPNIIYEKGLGYRYNDKPRNKRYDYVRNQILPGIVWLLNKETVTDDINDERRMYRVYISKLNKNEL